MKKLYLLSAGCLAALSLFLAGFEHVRSDYPAFVESTETGFGKNITITAKQYSPDESEKYLGRNLLSSGYQPIQVTIENHSKETYLISRDSISLPNATPGQVARSVSKKGLPRSIALKVAGFFCAPFMLLSTADGIYTIKTYSAMRSDYGAKGFKEKEEHLLPYSSTSRVIFVPKSKMKDSLTVTLLTPGGRAQSFTQTLAESKVSLDPVT